MTNAKKDKTLLMLAKLIKLHCRETGEANLGGGRLL
jgi:hypothetical protein